MTPLSLRQKILLACIFLILIFFSFYELTESPPFGFDEGWAVQVATNIAEKGIDGLQFSPSNFQHVSVLTSVGYPLIYTLALWFKIWGAGVLQARIMMALFMIMLAVVSFGLLKRLFGNTSALTSLGMLVTFPPFYSFGKNVIGEILVLLFLCLFLLFLHLAINNIRGRKPFWLILAGIAAGLCIVTKTMALAFVPVLVVGAIIALVRKEVSLKDISIIALCAVLPIVVWIIANFQPGDTLASVADYYTNPAAVVDKVGNMKHNLNMLFTTFVGLSTLSLLGAWVIGTAFRLKNKIRIHTEEYIALIFACVIMVAFFRLYGDARYLFPIEALALFFVPYSLHCMWSAIPMGIEENGKQKIYSAVVVLVCVVGLYQLSFNSYVADSYGSDFRKNLSAYFSEIPESTSIFFYNSTHVIPAFQGENYYQRIRMFDKWILGSELDPLISKGQVDMVVINSGLLKEDAEVDLGAYEKTTEFGQISVYKKIKK